MSRFALFRAPVDPSHARQAVRQVRARLGVEPRHIALHRAGTELRIAVVRHPTARCINLRVRRRNGEVVMTLPMQAEIGRAREFAESCFEWIAELVARRPPRVELAPGSVIPLRGESCTIAVGKPHGRPRLRRTKGGLRLYVCPLTPEASTRAYLERVAAADLRKAVSSYAARLGVRPSGIQIKDTSSRWGSCSCDGHLCFSWRLALAPPFVLDYLAAHEVGHLRDMSHSPAYWALVRGVCPRTEEAEAWLKDNDTALYSVG